MSTYRVKITALSNDEFGRQSVFGISVGNSKNEANTFDDIFSSCEKAEHIVEILNREQLDPIHLPQVIGDYLQFGTL